MIQDAPVEGTDQFKCSASARATLHSRVKTPPAWTVFNFKPCRASDKVAQASSPASGSGVPPGVGAGTGGETPPKLAGEDAYATLCHWLRLALRKL